MLSFINNTYELSSLINTLFALTIKFEFLKQILEDFRKNENFEKKFFIFEKFQISQKFLDVEKTSKNLNMASESRIWGVGPSKIFWWVKINYIHPKSNIG